MFGWGAYIVFLGLNLHGGCGGWCFAISCLVDLGVFVVYLLICYVGGLR